MNTSANDKKLRENEALYRALFDATGSAYLVLAPDAPRFTIKDVNQAYLRVTMTEREGILGRGLFEVFPDNPHDPGANGERDLRASFERALASRQPDAMAVLKYDIRRPDGSFEERHWSPVNTPILNDAGEPVGIIHHAEDVTDFMQASLERASAEAAMRASDEQYRVLFESIDEGFCVIEMLFDDDRNPIDYRFLQANPAFEKQTGLVDSIGRTMREMVSGHEESWFQIYGRIALTGEAARFEQEAAALGRWYDVYAFRVGQPEQRQVAILFRDVIERKRAEAAMREQQERVRRVEKLAAAGQLAASLAHEINNPLASITNLLYLLETSPDLGAAAREYATLAASELDRVSLIVKQSLSYYRVDTVPVSLNLGQVTKESLEVYRGKLEKAGIEVTHEVSSQSMLLGYPNELRQAIDNLLLNALQAMPEGGRLAVSVRESSEWAQNGSTRRGMRITIGDTGCGMPREIRERIFEPFFTTKSEKGTGLGLWVLQGIVAKHEGRISVRSSDDPMRRGTVISIFLPTLRAIPEATRLVKPVDMRQIVQELARLG